MARIGGVPPFAEIPTTAAKAAGKKAKGKKPVTRPAAITKPKAPAADSAELTTTKPKSILDKARAIAKKIGDHIDTGNIE